MEGLVRAAGRRRRGGAAERRPVRDLLCPTPPVFWEQRVALLLAVVVIASVTSHMPARFRHRSFRPDLEAVARRAWASGGRAVRP